MTDQLVIDIKAKVKPIIKFGFIFQGVIILLAVIAFLFLGLQTIGEIWLLGLFGIGAAIFFFYVSKKYFDNVFFKEKVILNHDTITIVNRTLTKEKTHEFQVKDIKYFGYAGTIEYTEHPMDNKVVDFTGLATGEREVQYLIDDGTIEIETEDEVLRFGKNMTSWDTEDIMKRIEDFLKTKFESKYPTDVINE